MKAFLETLDEPTQGRLISFLLSAPLGDGGQWDMLCNLVRKYGVVPKEAMPETVSSSATREMTSALTRKLREDAWPSAQGLRRWFHFRRASPKEGSYDGRNLSRFMHLPWRTSKDF